MPFKVSRLRLRPHSRRVLSRIRIFIRTQACWSVPALPVALVQSAVLDRNLLAAQLMRLLADVQGLLFQSRVHPRASPAACPSHVDAVVDLSRNPPLLILKSPRDLWLTRCSNPPLCPRLRMSTCIASHRCGPDPIDVSTHVSTRSCALSISFDSSSSMNHGFIYLFAPHDPSTPQSAPTKLWSLRRLCLGLGGPLQSILVLYARRISYMVHCMPVPVL